MAKDKKSIVVYVDWIDKFEALTDEEAGKLIKHFFRYVNDLNPKADDRTTELMFIDIKNTLKRDLKKYEQRAERSRINGAMGGRPRIKKPRKPSGLFKNPDEPKKPDSVSDSVSDSDNVNTKVFIAPTLNEFLTYAKTIEIYKPELDFAIKSKFESWEESKWIDGNGTKIKNWKTKLKNTLPYLKPVYKNDKQELPKQNTPIRRSGQW